MNAVRSKWLALAALLAFAPVAAVAQARPSAPGQAKQTSPISALVSGTSDAGAVEGVFDVGGFYVADGQVWATGVFTGTVGEEHVTTAARAPLEKSDGSPVGTAGSGIGIQQLAECPILDLNIGAIHLDLLGLVVDIAPIAIDIVAQPGAGNLLGNLLCAVAGLLDPGPGAVLGQLLNQIAALLNQILGILTP